MRTSILAAALAGLAALSIPAGQAFAADVTREERVAKLPETAADHAAMAQDYADRAAAWHKEAAYHREMAAAYKKSKPGSKDAVTMEKHCNQIAQEADKLGGEAEVMANYHRMRAKEMEGK